MRKIEIPLVGVHYRVTLTAIKNLEKAVPISCRFEREPDNQYDFNAIAVYLVEPPWKNLQIGYVARAVAAEIAPRMDKGQFHVLEAWVTVINTEDGTGELQVKWAKSRPEVKMA
jgi:hypothetical protein